MRIACLLTLSLLVGQLSAQVGTGEDVKQVLVTNQSAVNSREPDFSPAFYQGGVVYVTTNLRQLGQGRAAPGGADAPSAATIYQASVDADGNLEEPVAFSQGPTGISDIGPATFSTDGTELYFTRNDVELMSRRAQRRRRRKAGGKRLRIYTAQRRGGTWEPEQLATFNDDRANNAHPAISEDGQLLIFASDRKGGFGGMDLYGVDLGDDGRWGRPYNLGRQINGPTDDVFPRLAPDGTLYFSKRVAGVSEDEADRPPRPFHLDLYSAILDLGLWDKAVRLPEPFNSAYDDLGIITDSSNLFGYFSSDRPGGVGADDIYAFRYPGAVPPSSELPEALLTIVATDAQTALPLATTRITYLNTTTTSLSDALERGLISGGDAQGFQLRGGTSVVTDFEGRREVGVTAGQYLLRLEHDGYAPVQLPFTMGEEDLTLPIALEPSAACVKLRINVLDEATLRPLGGATVRMSGQNPGNALTLSSDANGTMLACLPCGEIYGMTATLGTRRSAPAAFDTRGAGCRRGETTTLTMYLRGAPPAPRVVVAPLAAPTAPARTVTSPTRTTTRRARPQPSRPSVTPPAGGSSENKSADGPRRFWVVAGTYNNDRQALKRQSYFEGLGYTGVFVTSFDASELRAVVVGRFDKLSDAAGFSKAVHEAHRVEAYVRRVSME